MQTRSLRIGMIAPPWLPVPPRAYGGTELVIDTLCDGLSRAGHEVTLFTIGESTCPVERRFLFEHGDPDRMGNSLVELRHVAAAYDQFVHPSSRVEIVHDHTLSGLFVSALYPDVPVVTTNHGPFTDDLADIYRRVAARIPVIAISDDQASHAPVDVPIARVIRHGLDLDRYPLGAGDQGTALFLGRMAPDKGVDVAIRVARAAGLSLVIAAKMVEPLERRYFDESIRPLLGPDAVYIGEADFRTKIELLTGSVALVNPISWPEPFGLVMAEALACGTPVMTFPVGAATEIVTHGLTGYLATDEDDLVDGLRRWSEIDRVACRRRAEDHFSAGRMVDEHVDLYRSVVRDHRAPTNASTTFSMRWSA
jgi:glycosyltransferase involved in cell wall biosynthesis